jgi:hypothetical protein
MTPVAPESVRAACLRALLSFQLNALAAAGDASDRVIPSHSPENQSVRFLGSSHFAVARRAY